MKGICFCGGVSPISTQQYKNKNFVTDEENGRIAGWQEKWYDVDDGIYQIHYVYFWMEYIFVMFPSWEIEQVFYKSRENE